MRRHAKAPSAGLSKRQAAGRPGQGAVATRGASIGFDGSGAPTVGRPRFLATGLLTLVCCFAFGATTASAAAPTVGLNTIFETYPVKARFISYLNTEGKETHYHFEYMTDAQYVAEGNTFNNATIVDEGVMDAGGADYVRFTVEGLTPTTKYRARFVATNEDGTIAQIMTRYETSNEFFETKEEELPAVGTETVKGVNTTEATLNADMDARGVNPTYQFEYVDLASYEAEGFNGASTTPSEPLTGPHASQSISGLEPDTAYRWKAVVTNQKGSTEGTVKDFHTFAFPSETETCPNAARRIEEHATFLPSCRAYEMVSPPDKNGGDILAYPYRTRVSQDGESIQFASALGFADAHGSGAAFEYMATRSGDGWQTHGITPSLPTESAKTQIGGDDFFKGEFSPDLSKGIFQASRPLVPGPTVEETPATIQSAINLYARDDLTVPGAGHWRPVTLCPACYVARLAVDATGGEFALTFKGQETSALPYNASNEAISEALEALSTVGAGNVRVSTPDGTVEGTHDVLFARELSANTQDEAEQLIASLGVNGSSLTGGSGSVAMAETPVLFPFVSPTNNGPNAPWVVGASPDFSRVLFESLEDLTAEANPQPAFCAKDAYFAIPGVIFCNTRLYEWEDGTIRLAGILPNGDPADLSEGGTGAHIPHYTRHAVSNESDGHSRVVFTQPTTGTGQTVSEAGLFEQIGLNIQGSEGNLFMREDHSQTVKLNASERAVPDEFHPASFLDATPDGKRVFFRSAQALTNDATANALWKIYVYDVTPDSEGHHLSLVSGPSGYADGLLGISDDGHYAYYTSNEGFTFWHDGVTKTITPGPYSGSDESPSLTNPYSGESALQSRVTPDGQRVIYRSNISGECEFGCNEVYVYDAGTENSVCGSCPVSGEPSTSGAGTIVVGFHGPTQPPIKIGKITPDTGRYVFFSTEEPLVPRDTNGVSDAYQYDTETGQTRLLSSGTSKFGSWYLDTSADGRDVFIDTNERLVGWDTDESYDVYDVRVEGGLPEPPATHATCTGETCQGSATPAPQVPPLSSNLESAGNVKEGRKSCGRRRRAHKKARRCRKRHHKRSGRGREAGR